MVVVEAGSVVVIVPRLVTPLLAECEVPLPAPERWGRTRISLPEELGSGPFVDRLTGRRHEGGGELQLSDLLSELPVALLTLDAPEN